MDHCLPAALSTVDGAIVHFEHILGMRSDDIRGVTSEEQHLIGRGIFWTWAT